MAEVGIGEILVGFVNIWFDFWRGPLHIRLALCFQGRQLRLRLRSGLAKKLGNNIITYLLAYLLAVQRGYLLLAYPLAVQRGYLILAYIIAVQRGLPQFKRGPPHVFTYPLPRANLVFEPGTFHMRTADVHLRPPSGLDVAICPHVLNASARHP